MSTTTDSDAAPAPAPAPAPGAPLLRTVDVDVVREGRYLLRSISLTIDPGEHWAVLGTNGAGKSTLLALLGATNHPSRGEVQVLGHRLGQVDLRELRTRIGHVNPRHPLRSRLPVRSVVLTGLTNSVELPPRWRPTAEQVAQAERLIDTLGIGHRADSPWPTLSQGERGRTLIARALMPSPQLLLLDEPATGLDLPAREQLLTALDELRLAHPSLATVLVTHHLEELPASTTHALLLREGECLGLGPVDEIMTTELVSACFDHPIRITRDEGRWSARAAAGRSVLTGA